jgi:O-antigen/teichoic acid export membrane protein
MPLSKLFSQLNNKHFLSLAGNGIMSLLGMATIAILYRSFATKEEAGIWVFFQTIILFTETFRWGFLTTAFIKFYAGSSDERKAEVVGSAWFIAIIITAGLFVLNVFIYMLFHNTTNESLSLFFKWFGITYIFSLPFFMATCIQQAEQRFDRLLYVRFMSQAFFILFICVLIYFKRITVQTVVYANLSGSLLTSLFVLFSGWSRVTDFAKRTKKGISEIYHFGKYSVGATISTVLLYNSDAFIINFMLGPAALAIYNLGRRLMEVIEIPIRSSFATAMPSMSAAFNNGKNEEVIYIMKKYNGVLTFSLIPLVAIAVVFANLAIVIIGGSKFADTEAANVFRLFMTFALLFPTDRFFSLTLDVIHKPRINFLKLLAMLAANIITDFIGIYVFGNVYGVALASIFPLIIALAVGYYALQRYEPFSFIGVFTTGFQEFKYAIAQAIRKFGVARIGSS